MHRLARCVSVRPAIYAKPLKCPLRKPQPFVAACEKAPGIGGFGVVEVTAASSFKTRRRRGARSPQRFRTGAVLSPGAAGTAYTESAEPDPIESTPLYACARSISCLLMTTSPESMGGGYSRHFYIGLTTQWRGPKCHVAVQAARRGPLFRPCSRHGVDGGPCRSLSVRVARQSDLVVNPGGVVRVVRLKT